MIGVIKWLVSLESRHIDVSNGTNFTIFQQVGYHVGLVEVDIRNWTDSDFVVNMSLCMDE